MTVPKAFKACVPSFLPEVEAVGRTLTELLITFTRSFMLNLVETGAATVHVCVVAGLFTVVPQLLESVHVRVCELLAQADHKPQDQFSVQATVQVCDVIGLPPVHPVGVDSVTVRVWVPEIQVDQAE